MPVSHAKLYRRTCGGSYAVRAARRTDCPLDNLQPRLSPFGLLIRTIIDHDYMLLREPRE